MKTSPHRFDTAAPFSAAPGPPPSGEGVVQPLLEVTRGTIVESIHHGSIAVVDSNGKLIASYGDPQAVAFLRSSAKPFQAIPFVERGGAEHFQYTARELAITCASHEGSSMHVKTVAEMQEKIGIEEHHMQCGVHMPGDAGEFKSLVMNKMAPTLNHNNCSGKHTSMLAYAKMRGLPLENYLDPDHPLQQDILATFSGMCLLPSDRISLGIDGCSAPNFAIPLFNAAHAVARLCDPRELDQARGVACQKITAAMTAHPEMVSGFGEFDCEMMKAGEGEIVCKRGAEGFQIIGLLPGAIRNSSLGIGIAFKVSDGDASQRNLNLQMNNRVRPAVALEILRQIGALSSKQEQALAGFGPVKQIKNHRGTVTGQSRPVFEL